MISQKIDKLSNENVKLFHWKFFSTKKLKKIIKNGKLYL
jgi:hypothetical protein